MRALLQNLLVVFLWLVVLAGLVVLLGPCVTQPWGVIGMILSR